MTHYRDRVWGWAQHLRAGGELTWDDYAATQAHTTPNGGRGAEAGPVGEPVTGELRALPTAPQLELLRRLDASLPAFGELADRVLATSGAGRGLVDALPPAPDAPYVGTQLPPPEALPAAELLRVVVAVMAPLLAEAPLPAHPTLPTPRWWQRRPRAQVHGAGLPAAAFAAQLSRAGWKLQPSRAHQLIVGADVATMMAQHWSSTIYAGEELTWRRLWQTVTAHDELPATLQLPQVARALAKRWGTSRTIIVLAGADLSSLPVAATPVTVEEPLQPQVATTQLFAHLNPLLDLQVGLAGREQLLPAAWQWCSQADRWRGISPPQRHWEWLQRQGEAMAAELASDVAAGRYQLIGEPEAVLAREPAAPQPLLDDKQLLEHAILLLERLWSRGHRHPTSSTGHAPRSAEPAEPAQPAAAPPDPTVHPDQAGE